MSATVDVYCFPLTDKNLIRAVANRAVPLLDDHERSRLTLFKNPGARDRFLIARYISKTRLGRELKCKPEDVRFRYSTNGKPSLGNESDAGWWFSLSHCAGAVVCAIADSDIGVDVESLLRCEKLVAKSGGFFSPGMAARVMEVEYLPSAVAFAGFWTSLEAQVKLKDSSIFSERRIFELVPDISGRYGNNQDINLMAVTVGAENIISVACRCNFEMNILLPKKCTTLPESGLTWQPAEQNAVELLFSASGNVKRGDFHATS